MPATPEKKTPDEVALLGPIFINLLANRRKPPLAKLSEITDPERFLWQILPHAARSFSFVIVFLPPRMRRALAIAYLYCRMLDTYEDLMPTLPQQESALKRFVRRFDSPGDLKSAPALDPALTADPRESTHVLLVNRAALIDHHFELLASSQQAAICRLVQRMGEGMIWASRIFKKQDGILQTPAQLSRYCWHVLGTPILFADEMQRLDRGLSPHIGEARLRQCAVVGEVIQLANITRDLEKDVRRGVFYHPQLRGIQSARCKERIREVRAQLVLRALRGFRQFPPFFNALPAAPISRARGAAMLLIITTYSYYWHAAQKADLPAFDKQQRITRLGGAFIWLKCVLSRRASARFMSWLEKTVVIAFERCQPDRSKRFVWEDGGFDVVALLK